MQCQQITVRRHPKLVSVTDRTVDIEALQTAALRADLDRQSEEAGRLCWADPTERIRAALVQLLTSNDITTVVVHQ